MFLEQQISILEGFLKDHVTLKTREMAAKKFSLPSQVFLIKKVEETFKNMK